MLRKGLNLIIAGMYTLSTLTAIFTTAVVTAQQPDSEPLFEYSAINHPVIGRRGMVASHNQLSSEIAAEILAKGGNAIDAGAALGFALAVTLPRAGNIGGGGFMLVHVAALNRTIAIDFRETAPLPQVKICFSMPMATLCSIKPTGSLTNLQLSQVQLQG